MSMTFGPVLADYATRRYPLIRYLEEPGGVVHLPVYIDSNGYATIGAGFKISSNAAVILSFPRNFVFQELGYNAPENWKEARS